MARLNRSIITRSRSNSPASYNRSIMKRSIYTLILGVIVCVLCCYQAIISFVQQKGEPSAQSAVAENVPDIIKPLRERITFILGEDREANNRYYAEATNYYTHNKKGRTEYLVTTCRSLLEVRDYLEQHKPGNGFPWGLINLVSHGNQWTGLSVRITPEIKRTTTARLEECIADGTWKPLPEVVVDKDTEILLHGCGVGNNQRLINTLAVAFGGHDHQPVVRASKLFEYYASINNNDISETEHYLANTWTVSYRMGERPGTMQLMNELREKYPHAAVDWHGALSREQPRWTGDSYHYTFEIPVKWILRMSHDSIPGERSQLAWIARHREITTDLDGLQIPYNQFKWSFTKVYADNDDGTKSAAIWVKGYCTILTVLQALTSADSGQGLLSAPFEPAQSDSGYYYTSRNRIKG